MITAFNTTDNDNGISATTTNKWKWLRTTYIKTFSWEYWPMWLVYLPASFYFIYLAIKARSIFFFSAANPTIETGGMLFESKWDIFKLIPPQYYPATILVTANENIDTVLSKKSIAAIDFPLIAKPDRGERGWCVTIIKTVTELQQYIAEKPIDFLIQEYIAYPVELSIFYFRHPDAATGTITSVTRKEYLKVTGNGVSTLQELINANDRAFLQRDKLQRITAIDTNKVLQRGEIKILVPFGNHVRGAMFLDDHAIIDDGLTAVIDTMAKQIDGFYFGRFDLKCKSIDDLKAGKHFSVLELNGSGAEPAHIYQPGFSFIKAQRVIMQHYKMMYAAAKANHKKGITYMSLSDFRAICKAQKEHKQKVVTV
jgi:hypothetical protein